MDDLADHIHIANADHGRKWKVQSKRRKLSLVPSKCTYSSGIFVSTVN